MADPVELWAYSIFGASSRKGLVKIVKNKDVFAQLSPAEARSWAMNILEAAEAAETDEFLMEMFTKKIELTDENALAVLQDFREHRDKKRGASDA